MKGATAAQLKELRAPFHPNDLEWRVQMLGVNKQGPYALIVPYVTARAVQERLDDVCGPANWRNERYEKGPLGGMLAGLSIYVDRGKDEYGLDAGEWVTKWDGADNPKGNNSEGAADMVIKGGMSASDKRAAVKWGIGRDLYYLDAMYAKPLPEGQRGQYRAFGMGKDSTKRGEKVEVAFNYNAPDLPAWYMNLLREAEAERAAQRGAAAPEDEESVPEPEGSDHGGTGNNAGDDGGKEEPKSRSRAATKKTEDKESGKAGPTTPSSNSGNAGSSGSAPNNLSEELKLATAVAVARRNLLNRIERMVKLDYNAMNDVQQKSFKKITVLVEDQNAKLENLQASIEWSDRLLWHFNVEPPVNVETPEPQVNEKDADTIERLRARYMTLLDECKIKSEVKRKKFQKDHGVKSVANDVVTVSELKKLIHSLELIKAGVREKP